MSNPSTSTPDRAFSESELLEWTATERATLDAVPPEERLESGGWLVALDHGTVQRAHSAAPLIHDASLLDGLTNVIGLYQRAGLQPCFRLPDVNALQPVRDQLKALGYVCSEATWVQWATCEDLMTPELKQAAQRSELTLRSEPDADWCGVFLGEGFDPVDGASRTAILRRARAASYARVVIDGKTVAVGMGSYSEGWASIHGMRTLPAWRGRGYAQAIMGRLITEALSQRFARVFLQVEASNRHAHALYSRMGFQNLWTYRYWSPGAAA